MRPILREINVRNFRAEGWVSPNKACAHHLEDQIRANTITPVFSHFLDLSFRKYLDIQKITELIPSFYRGHLELRQTICM